MTKTDSQLLDFMFKNLMKFTFKVWGRKFTRMYINFDKIIGNLLI